MLIAKRPETNYEIPDERQHRATLIQVKDLGATKTAFGVKELVVFVWETDQLDRDGKPRRAFQRFNRNLHEKSSLRKAIRSITGDEPGDEFDLEALIGRTVDLVIEHNQSNGRTFANIASIIRRKSA